MCRTKHEHHVWLFCQREPKHKGKHGVVAYNPGQWLGNKSSGTWVATWGFDEKAA